LAARHAQDVAEAGDYYAFLSKLHRLVNFSGWNYANGAAWTSYDFNVVW
jgi:hypothetical protein